MRRKKMTAFLLAAATAIGSMAPAIPAIAAEIGSGNPNQTEVTLQIEAKNTPTYEIVVPSATTLDADGNKTMLDGGITVKGKDLTSDIKVEAKSEKDWKLTGTSGSSIGYELCDYDENATTEWTFEHTVINKYTWQRQDVYAKVDTEDVNSAEAGEYSDVITFTASVAETPGDSDTDTKSYVQVTDDNIEAVLLADASKAENKVYDTEDNAMKQAAELSKSTDKKVYVIYKLDNSGNFYMVSSDADYVSLTWIEIEENYMNKWAIYIAR